MNKRYFGAFVSYDEMVGAFMDAGYDYDKRENRKADLPSGFPSDEQVMFAAYGTEESYQGDGTVVYKDADDKLYIVSGSHCSCYGLEGQWTPSETTENALAMMELSTCDYDSETLAAFRAMWPKKEDGQ